MKALSSSHRTRHTNMPVEYLKKAAKTSESESGGARKVAADMLADIAQRGEVAVREYAATLDHWTGEIVVTPQVRARRTAFGARRHRLRHRAGQPLRAGAARLHPRFRNRNPSGTRRRPAPRSGQRGRLLRADRPLRT